MEAKQGSSRGGPCAVRVGGIGSGMLLLPSGRSPAAIAHLDQEIGEGLERVFGVANGLSRVVLEGCWPDLKRLEIDLTGVHTDPANPPAGPVGKTLSPGEAEGRIRGRLRLRADPLRLGLKAEVRLEVEAEEVDLVAGRDEEGRLWLMPSHCVSGQATVGMEGQDLEDVFLEGARQAAERHGVRIEDGSLTLRQSNERELTLEAALEARKLFVKSRIRLRGRIGVDARLNIHLSDLSCEGEGMLATIACQFLQPRLAEWERRPLPLLAMAFPAVRLHHATLSTDSLGRLHAEAKFGEC